MERVSYVLRISQQHYDEYVERHRHVYPELLAAFEQVGIHTYSIFYCDGLLFAYMEVGNFNDAMEKLSSHPANLKWQDFMSDLLIKWENGEAVRVIPEVFHFTS